MSNILAVVNTVIIEDFSIINVHTKEPVTGLSDDDFTRNLYNPSNVEVSSTIPVTISELSNGNYRSTFTPNVIGTWYLTVYNSLYCPGGKGGTIQVYDSDFNSITAQNKRILGLVHQNMVIDEAGYDQWGNMESARVRIFEDSAKTILLATYRISVNTTAPGRFSNWEQVEE